MPDIFAATGQNLASRTLAFVVHPPKTSHPGKSLGLLISAVTR